MRTFLFWQFFFFFFFFWTYNLNHLIKSSNYLIKYVIQHTRYSNFCQWVCEQEKKDIELQNIFFLLEFLFYKYDSFFKTLLIKKHYQQIWQFPTNFDETSAFTGIRKIEWIFYLVFLDKNYLQCNLGFNERSKTTKCLTLRNLLQCTIQISLNIFAKTTFFEIQNNLLLAEISF